MSKRKKGLRSRQGSDPERFIGCVKNLMLRKRVQWRILSRGIKGMNLYFGTFILVAGYRLNQSSSTVLIQGGNDAGQN